uniref:Uncharacterized protein n=1 Tax=Anguilla anguilla TaxID=7936 RepID=A0A0E9QH35_ANGAN
MALWNCSKKFRAFLCGDQVLRAFLMENEFF